MSGPPGFDVDALLRDDHTRIIVCCGAGGVGKTTTSAALGVRAADAGRKVVVLTIDPARRLAQALGLGELDNTPRPVPGVGGPGGGQLHAMMLDMKRTFDEIVEAHSTPDRAVTILANPFYQSLSSSFSGTQEYMAMEKLGQLRAQGDWDLIIVDTPPSRSALDFLDAPQRMARFLDGRMIRLLAAPAKAGGRAYLKVVGAGLSLFARILTKILGAQVLTDVSAFIGALDAMFGGFRERAEATYEMLSEPGTAFVVIAAPEPDALREASFFVDRLAADSMPLAGLLVNRVHRSEVPELSAQKAESLADVLTESAPGSAAKAETAELTAGVLRIHAELMTTARRERRLTERFGSAHPTVPMREIPALARDVHDLPSLRAVGQALGGE